MITLREHPSLHIVTNIYCVCVGVTKTLKVYYLSIFQTCHAVLLTIATTLCVTFCAILHRQGWSISYQLGVCAF